MIVSHKHKFIFVHVPKTGGTSVVKALYPYLDHKNDIILGGHPDHEDNNDQDKKKAGELHKHSTALEIKKKVGEKIWNEYFIFAFVRNPYDRIASVYEWWKQTPWSGENKKKKEISEMKFEEFAASHYTGHPMVDFLSSKRTKKFYVEHSRIIEVDFIGSLEDAWGSFAYICGMLNLPKIALEKHNVSKNKKPTYQEYYNSKSISTIQAKFKEDLEKFNYRFDWGSDLGIEPEDKAIDL